MKHGPVTLLSVVEDRTRFKLLAAQAECVPGEVLRIGNTNSHYRFPIGAKALSKPGTLKARHTIAPSASAIWPLG